MGGVGQGVRWDPQIGEGVLGDAYGRGMCYAACALYAPEKI